MFSIYAYNCIGATTGNFKSHFPLISFPVCRVLLTQTEWNEKARQEEGPVLLQPTR